VVELRGFEPLTPSMRTRCATGLRYSPWNQSQPSKLCVLLAPSTVKADDGGLPACERLDRLRSIARLGEMADQGDFDEFLVDKRACR
jgi:hypothetical protein